MEMKAIHVLHWIDEATPEELQLVRDYMGKYGKRNETQPAKPKAKRKRRSKADVPGFMESEGRSDD